MLKTVFSALTVTTLLLGGAAFAAEPSPSPVAATTQPSPATVATPTAKATPISHHSVKHASSKPASESDSTAKGK